MFMLTYPVPWISFRILALFKSSATGAVFWRLSSTPRDRISMRSQPRRLGIISWPLCSQESTIVAAKGRHGDDQAVVLWRKKLDSTQISDTSKDTYTTILCLLLGLLNADSEPSTLLQACCPNKEDTGALLYAGKAII